MVYPDEVSRLAKTTAAGTAYTEITVSPYGSGDTALVCVPGALADGAASVVVLCAHGHSGSEATINSAMMTPTRNNALDRGWVVASSYAHGNAWANPAALADYRRVWDWINDTWPVGDTLLHGQSMGALTTANLYSRDSIPKVRGMVGIDGAYNLASAFANTNYKPSIRTAYGIAADGSDYDTKTAGHDAVLLPPGTFAGKRLFLSSSNFDTAIPKATNTDLFVSNLGTSPALIDSRLGNGEHVTSGNYYGTAATEFFEAALAAAPPDPVAPVWPDPIALPEGVVQVELYIADDLGRLVRIDPVGIF